MRIAKKHIKRFLEHVKKTRTCWLWTASKTRKGYGYFRFTRKKLFRSHRFAYLIFKGPIPRKKLVCHKCDFPGCVNPRHLWIGTPDQNMKDMVKKHRQSKGEDVYCSTLTEKKVKKIRKLYKTRKITQYKLSKKYKVVQSVISEIIHKSLWKHLR